MSTGTRRGVGGLSWWIALGAAALVAGCTDTHGDEDENGDLRDGGEGPGEDEGPSGSRDGVLPPDGPACVTSKVTAEIAVTNNDKIDLLFVVDNSASMAEEQASLREQFPRLISVLTTGERADGSTFPAARELHLGVVSSDMG